MVAALAAALITAVVAYAVPPTVTITSPPDGIDTNNNAPTIAGSAEAVATEPVTVNIYAGLNPGPTDLPVQTQTTTPDGTTGAWSVTPTALNDGSYTITATQTNTDGTTTSAPDHATIDTTPPTTTITSKPSGIVVAPSAAVFHFSSNEAGSTFQCQLDGGGWAGCGSPASYAGLSDGSHSFQVRAIDQAGNVDPSPAVAAFTYDTPPNTTITSGPASTGTTDAPVFSFTSSKAGGSFQCKLDGGAWAACASPDALGPLSEGAHTFAVRAVDQLGVADPSPASAVFTFDIAPTTKLSGPTGAWNLPTFTFSSKPGSTFKCRLDAGAWSPCGSPDTLSGLANGPHTFAVQATDAFGNVDPNPPAIAFVITPPVQSRPVGPSATFVWFPSSPAVGQKITLVSTSANGSSPIKTTAWDLSGNGSYTTIGTTTTVSFKTAGPHVVHLRVTDANGLTSTTQSTITVAAPLLRIQPFPIVRIGGFLVGGGARITVLTVWAPPGVHITATCHGRGCPRGTIARVARALDAGSARKRRHKLVRKRGPVIVVLGSLERFLRAGAVIDIRVTQPGRIGKDTRFVIRRGKAPQRADRCLMPGGGGPVVCPS